MEFSHVGSHCHYRQCHQHDYLPFNCEHCHHSFCLNHRTAEQHECSVAQQQQQAQKEVEDLLPTLAGTKLTHINPYRCSHAQCKKREAQQNVCKGCDKNYCLKHRFVYMHECKKVDRNNRAPVAKPRTTLPVHPQATSCGQEMAQQQQPTSQQQQPRNGRTNIAAMGSRLLQAH